MFMSVCQSPTRYQICGDHCTGKYEPACAGDVDAGFHVSHHKFNPYYLFGDRQRISFHIFAKTTCSFSKIKLGRKKNQKFPFEELRVFILLDLGVRLYQPLRGFMNDIPYGFCLYVVFLNNLRSAGLNRECSVTVHLILSLPRQTPFENHLPRHYIHFQVEKCFTFVSNS